MNKKTAPKITIACFSCGRTQTLRKSKLQECSLYTCGLGSCAQSGEEPPAVLFPATIKTITYNAAGGFCGVRYEVPDADHVAAVERAKAIRDAAMKR